MRHAAVIVLSLSLAHAALKKDPYPYYNSIPFDTGDLGSYPNRTYITEPSLISPRLNILKADARCHDGLYTMISLRGDKVALKGQSPMIFDTRGNLVWMNATYKETFGLAVQEYKGERYLTFWQGDDSIGGHGEGYYYMLDSSYRVAFRLSAGNGKPGDLHEFRITRNGTAIITQYLFREARFGGRITKGRKGFIWDSVVQEVDIETNKVIFEWHASDHMNIDESDFPSGDTSRHKKSGYDFFHINSVDKDRFGNYLISSRYYQSITYINGSSGEILWNLGGKNNSFKDLSGGQATKFGWQHDARWNADHTGITLFNNGARYGLKPTLDDSRGVHLNLDLEAMTAEVRHTYVNPRKIISASQGSMQILPSGNILLGYGYNAAWTEFSPSGQMLCDVHIGSRRTFNTGAVQTYKVLKHAWKGQPITSPRIKFREGVIYTSWNGATEIANWALQTSISEDMQTQAGLQMVQKLGFETSTEIDCHQVLFVRAVAVDKNGHTLGTTEKIQISCEYQSLFVQTTYSLFGVAGFETKVLLAPSGISLFAVSISVLGHRRRLVQKTFFFISQRILDR